jgi:hypothetical protein
MKRHHIASIMFAATSIVVVGVALAEKDRYSLKAPSGLSFAEFKGYEQWQMVGSSQADDASGCGTSPDPGCIKSILGNAVLINAYSKGIPDNGQPVPDGAAFVKIEWRKIRDTAAPYGANVPGDLAEVAFMLKDSKRFPERDGWGYATFQYDSASDSWNAKSDDGASCHGCHTLVKARDFVFTHYPKR